MLSAQNQRNRALKRAFEGTTAGSVLASAGALPDAIAAQTTPDEKFLSLNRWRQPSEVLPRNWRWKVLNGNELGDCVIGAYILMRKIASSLHKSRIRRHL